MYIPYKKLVEMLHSTYSAGRTSSSDLREQVVEEILAEFNVAKLQDFRVYSVDELRNFPPGSMFCHSMLGKCEIIHKKGMRKPFMKFDNGATHQFSADSFPWDVPMVYLGDK
jgi:hypothetical protein